MKAISPQKITLFAFLICFLQGCTSASMESPRAACDAAVTVACLIELAEQDAARISDPNDRVTAMLEIATAQFAAGLDERAAASILGAQRQASSIGDASTRTKAQVLLQATSASLACVAYTSHGDARDGVLAQDNADNVADSLGKLIVAAARCGDSKQSIDDAHAMQQSTDMLASYKARTLHELAPVVARQQSLAAAAALLQSIDMGLPYYRAVAGNEVARIAVEQGDLELAQQLLRTTEQLADVEQNGYFKAGMYREAAATYHVMGSAERSQQLFQQAIDATELAPSAQHRARSLSRVATVLSDFKRFSTARSVFPLSMSIAQTIESEQLRSWAFYEIAGGAAFSGDFATAMSALNEIPGELEMGGSRLQSATQRDVAWGYAKHGERQVALQLVLGIETPRERVQALSRIARLLADANMHALPRYL